MRDWLLNIVAVLLWVPAFILKLVLAIVGLVAVPLTKPDNPIWGNREHPIPPNWYKPGAKAWVRDYFWRALRNPVNNTRYLIEPRDPTYRLGHRNPDEIRKTGEKSATRFSRAALFAELWTMRRVGGDRFFEFRVGWKFGRSVPGFGFTFQLGVRNR